MEIQGPLADRVTRLGPAIESFPIVGAALLDRATLAVVSRNLRPARVALLDPATGAARAVVEVPTGDGAWAITPDGAGGAWLGMFGARGRANLYRLDGAAARIEVAAAIDAVHLWDLAVADDGTVVGVSDGPAGLYAFDPRTWLARDLEAVQTGPELARSVAVIGRTALVGGRRDGRALLRAVDLDTRARREVLPEQLADHAIVYSLATGGGALALGTRGPSRRDPAIALLDAGALAAPPLQTVTVPGADVVDSLLVTGDTTWATVRPSGALVRLDRGGDTAVEVARPVPMAEQRGVFRRDPADPTLIGASADGSIWQVDPATGASSARDLVGDGLVDGGPEIVQSLAAADGRVWAGGTFGVAVRTGQGPLVRTAVPGEPKALAVVDGTLYLAIYPIAEVWVQPPDAPPERLVALPPIENRPLSLDHHAERDVLLVGTAADAGGGGGFHVVVRDSGELIRSIRDPLGSAQAVARVRAAGELALLGGRDATVVALALADSAEVWRVDRPVPDGGPVSGLTVLGDDVHVLTAGGWHLVRDLATGAETHRERIGTTGGGLAVAGGHVYGVDADRLLRFRADGTSSEVLLTGLAPRHWAQPSLAADAGDLYVLAGTAILRVRPGTESGA